MEKDLKLVEKDIKKLIKNNLRDSTLDYSIQAVVSSSHPGKVMYNALIQSPSRHVQDMPFLADSMEELKAMVAAAFDEIDMEKLHLIEVESRINSLNRKIKSLQEYKDAIKEKGFDRDGYLKGDEDESER